MGKIQNATFTNVSAPQSWPNVSTWCVCLARPSVCTERDTGNRSRASLPCAPCSGDGNGSCAGTSSHTRDSSTGSSSDCCSLHCQAPAYVWRRQFSGIGSKFGQTPAGGRDKWTWKEGDLGWKSPNRRTSLRDDREGQTAVDDVQTALDEGQTALDEVHRRPMEYQ